MFDGKSILITGGTGSFGHKYTENLLSRYNPKRLIIYSRDELKQFEMQQKFNEYLVGEITDYYFNVGSKSRLCVCEWT